MNRRRFIRNAATGLMVPTLMGSVVHASVPLPVGFWRRRSAAPAVEPTISGLTNKWVFSNHSGDTVPDTVGSRDLTNHGGTFGSDGLAFDGSSQWADTAAFSFGSNADISVVIWYKAPAGSTSVGNRIFICKETVNSMFQAYENGSVTSWRTGSNEIQLGNSTYRDGGWHQLVFTRSGTSGIGYLDGSYSNSGSTMQNFTDSSTVFNVGRYSSFGGGYYCNGTFGLVELYNVALTATNKNDLFAYWRTVFGV